MGTTASKVIEILEKERKTTSTENKFAYDYAISCIKHSEDMRNTIKLFSTEDNREWF